MNFEVNLWQLLLTIGSGIGAAFVYIRLTTNQLWVALNSHKDEDTKFHLDIVQNVVPNAMRDLAARMDARFDRLEDKIERKTK